MPADLSPGSNEARIPQSCKELSFFSTNRQRKKPMKTKNSRFDSLVARYYPAVYGFASRFTDDPREAIALTRHAFNAARKPLRNLGDQTAVATVLLSAVIRAGLTAA
ncbi:MAG: hypothetical protein DMF14_03140 [Verrucomicrobia bacterium]|nr:MAG: hypothetical protein DMF14_03140 [Verrucomicrobiota bacterium]